MNTRKPDLLPVLAIGAALLWGVVEWMALWRSRWLQRRPQARLQSRHPS